MYINFHLCRLLCQKAGSLFRDQSLSNFFLFNRTFLPSNRTFLPCFNNDTGESKPVIIVTVDGGHDENSRYTKTIGCAINYFTTKDLDVFFLATNAPRKTAFNRTEGRLVKFSQELRI